MNKKLRRAYRNVESSESTISKQVLQAFAADHVPNAVAIEYGLH